MVCIAIVGEPGSGKTATLAYMGMMYYQQGFKIHANFELFLPQPDGSKRTICHSIRTYRDFNNIRNGYFLGDELWSWIDARMSMSDANMFLSDVLLKARKRHFNLINTVQHLSQLEKRIRNITQYIIYPKSIITDPETGERIEIKQDLLHPIDMLPYLPYTTIHAFVTVPDPVTGVYDKVVNEFEFPLAIVASVYNTDEEVEELLSGELDKGIQEESRFCEFLHDIYPDAEVYHVPNSGINSYPISNDVELSKNGKLIRIYDVCTLYKGSNLEFKNKNVPNFLKIEKERGVTTFFAFMYKEKWMQMETKYIWDLKTKSIVVNKIKQYLKEFTPELLR